MRPVRAEVDLAAIRHNADVLAARAAPAALCAVVKANAYGHGDVAVARAALEAGATWLAVALVEEGIALRDGGVTAPILLLSEPPPEAMGDVVRFGLTATVYTEAGVKAMAAAGPAPVHLKVDTGMHRVGADPVSAVGLALAIERLGGVWTHFAVADVVDDPYTDRQAERFEAVLADLAAAGVRPALRHASNSAGALGHPRRRYDMVRCGIALYGVAPSPAMAGLVADLRPALSLRAQVSYVKEVEAGEGVSYGLRYRLAERSTVATVPIGYADGVPWRLGVCGGEVLIGGRRRPIAGAVTMDQITVDCGPDTSVHAGDEVVLLGRQGDERIGAQEWADRIGTIPYEILCGIGARVPREYAGVTPASGW